MHAIIIFLILRPLAINEFKGEHAVGGGGPGPAGGGGGGSRGGGERLRFVRIKPAPDAAAAVVPPKVVEPPKPIAPPVVATPQAAPTPAPPTAGTAVGAAGVGVNGGPGRGPGSGGGIGSGVGTGTGSANGPGTGGGPAGAYPPTPTQFFLPPLPAPASVRGYHLIAYFDVDSTGKATLLGFNPSRDGGYNRKLRDVLMSLRFRPGVKADGTPVRDTVDIQFIF